MGRSRARPHTCRLLGRSQVNAPVAGELGVLMRHRKLKELGLPQISLAARRSGGPDRTFARVHTERLVADPPAEAASMGWDRALGSGASSQAAARGQAARAGLRRARRNDRVRERQRILARQGSTRNDSAAQQTAPIREVTWSSD